MFLIICSKLQQYFICMTGAREFVRASRTSKPDDLLNSAIGGFGSGALLGRLQGEFHLLWHAFFFCYLHYFFCAFTRIVNQKVYMVILFHEFSV